MKLLLLLSGLLFLSGSFCSNDNKTIKDVEKNDVVIVFMDVWEEFPWNYENAELLALQENISVEEAKDRIEVWLDWWENEVAVNIQEKIIPLLEFARSNDIEIVFSRNYERLSHDLKNLSYREPIINLTDDLDAYLKGKGIDTIIYAGYALNNCILGNPTGVRAMAGLKYNVIVIRDATLTGAYQFVSEEEAIAEIEQVGSFTTVSEVMAELK